MTTPGLFVLKEDGALIPLSAAPYVTEGKLQELIERYPALLPGDQIDPESPRRWLLIKREHGVPGEASGTNRWSLDHLFVDQDGMPTLVEVKRAIDTRARREVVAQMLDYAANGASFWSLEELRAAFEATCRNNGVTPEDKLREFLGETADLEAFWQDVRTHLHAGRLRLLFVADEIQPELRRIVEFLNVQMEQTEVLAIEIRQFKGAGMLTLVPRLFGQTTQALEKKKPGGRKWDEESLFAFLAQRGKADEVRVCREMYDWCKNRFSRITFGRGAVYPSFVPVLDTADGWFGPVCFYAGSGEAFVEVRLAENGMKVPPFDNAANRASLAEKIRLATGLEIAKNAKYPNVPVRLLADGDRLKRFLDVIEWALLQVMTAQSLR